MLKKRYKGIRYKGIKDGLLYLYTSIPLYLLFLILVFAFATIAKGQQQVQIVSAERIEGDIINGQRVQKIIGNVHLRTEEMEMFADRAIKYPAIDLVKAFGNIQINTGEEMIWADSLTYYTDLDFAELRSRVIIKSDSTTLFGNAVDYRFTNNVAHFLDRIRLVDPGGVLTANQGFYFRRADSAAFRGQVQLRDSLNYAEGNFLFTDRAREYYELHGNVFAFDKENSSKLSGDYLEADSTGRNVIIGNAWLINFKEDTTNTEPASADTLQPLRPDTAVFVPTDSLAKQDSAAVIVGQDVRPTEPDTTGGTTSQPDTTHIRAHRIVSIQNRMANDTTTTVKAYENVRIWSPDFSAVSDSARYQNRTEIFELWMNAKVWYNQIQLSSPYIWVKLQEGDIKKLIAYPNPFVVRQDTSINRLNQIKGDTLTAFFTEGALEKMVVYPNSHLLHFTKQNNQPDGAIELTAPKTIIFFEEGELVEVKPLGIDALVKGYYRPESVLSEGKRLSGFSWNPDLRPKKPAQPMQRRFPPIPEEPPFALPERYLEYIQEAAAGSKQTTAATATIYL